MLTRTLAWRGLAGAGCAALLTGCGALSPDAAGAASVAHAFRRAVADGDGPTACELLAPAVVESLEHHTDEPCAAAVVGAEVTAAVVGTDDAAEEAAATVRAYGGQAQVEVAGDVLFLTVSGDGWLITGAGCTPRTDRPYDCALAGS